MHRNHPDLAGREYWIQPELSLIPDCRRTVYLARKTAVDMYAEGFRHADIQATTGIRRAKVLRFVNRCIRLAPEGVPWGYRALLPYQSLRGAPQPIADSPQDSRKTRLTQLFCDYPQLAEVLHSLITRGVIPGQRAISKRVTHIEIVRQFAKQCAEEGVPPEQWPRNARDHGYGVVRRLRLAYLNNNDKAAILRVVGPETAAALRRSQAQYRTNQRITRPYQRVELDAHWIDVEFVLLLPTSTPGGVLTPAFAGLWLLLLIDVYSRACIGYSFSFSKNYNSCDAIRAVRSAVLPSERSSLSLPGLAYPENVGLPCQVLPEYRFHGIESLYLDNALSHMSDASRKNVERTIGGTLVFGPAAAPNARAIIESFFAVLETQNLARLPSSTRDGGWKNDRAGKAAKKYIFTENHLTHLVELSCAKYNLRPAPASDTRRVDILRQYADSPRALFLTIPRARRENLQLFDLELELKVKGSRTAGSAPYVYWEGSKYSSPRFSEYWALVGETITCFADSLHVEQLQAFDGRAQPLGVLQAETRWRSKSHSLNTRRAVNRLRRPGVRLNEDSNDLDQYLNYLEAGAVKNKNTARELARFKHETTLAERSSQGTKSAPLNLESTHDEPTTADTRWIGHLDDFGML